MLRLKDNRPRLLEGAKAALAGADVKSACRGDLRNRAPCLRRAEVAPAAVLELRSVFPRLKATARLTVQQAGTQPEERFYFLSRRLTPERLINVARTHGATENSQHRVLNTAFAEDHARSRKNYAPQKLAVLRRLALNIARLHHRGLHPDKTPLRRKLLRAGWDETFFQIIKHRQ